MTAFVVLGEALIDLVETGDDEPRLARPGGGPYNVAIGLARLGQHAAFAGRMSRDPLGQVLRNHALRSGVDLSLCVAALEPSTVALVELDPAGGAQYRFGVEGTADFRWTDAELARIPDETAAVHFGSLTSWLPPGDGAVLRRVAALRETGGFVSYDPNVRPHLQPDPAVALAQVEAALAVAHLVKTSEEDIAYLHPDRPADEVATAWLDAGPQAVVVTRGGGGASAFTRAGEVARPVVPTDVVDTVGAGDAFMSGLLDALARRGLVGAAQLANAPFAEILDDAGLVAAITCSRAGANPPRAAELGR